jgi:NAD(P)-dependent dehydrogenase (short-subunit alcohol dehydrogenase family)
MPNGVRRYTLITGASSGIGRALAERLSCHPAPMFVVSSASAGDRQSLPLFYAFPPPDKVAIVVHQM